MSDKAFRLNMLIRQAFFNGLPRFDCVKAKPFGWTSFSLDTVKSQRRNAIHHPRCFCNFHTKRRRAFRWDSSLIRLPNPPASITAFKIELQRKSASKD